MRQFVGRQAQKSPALPGFSGAACPSLPTYPPTMSVGRTYPGGGGHKPTGLRLQPANLHFAKRIDPQTAGGRE